MSSLSMPASSLAMPALPGRAWWRRAGAAVAAVGVHALAFGLLFTQWQGSPPEAPQVRTLTTRLVSVAPPAPPQPEPVVQPVAEPVITPPAIFEPVTPIEPSRPDPRLQQQKLEQAALASKRVEQQRRQERERLERQQRERLERERVEQQHREAQVRQREQQRLAAEQAAERARQAAAAASRPYLPIAKQAPDYPQRALDRGIEGDCTVRYRVSAEGRVESPEVVGSCNPLFVRPSLEAARRFRYQPRIVEGRAVAVPDVRNTFEYRIQ